MPSIKDLKKRIGTVKNTQQTTRAMKMVSAAKLRRAQEAILNHRPYARRIDALIHRLSTSVSGNPSPLLRRELEGKPRVLLMVVTSDRGLCGGFNANAIKAAQRWLMANQADCQSVKLGFVGRKGYDFFKTKRVEMGPYLPEQGGKVTFQKARQVADLLVKMYLNDEVDEIKFVYNEFKNAVTQTVVVENFLPLQQVTPGAKPVDQETVASGVDDSTMYIVRPSEAEVLASLLEKNFAVQAFRVLLESQAGEHGARMSAMENATKNAGEMIRKLSLAYNKQRQASITKELLEIISGSESQKGQ